MEQDTQLASNTCVSHQKSWTLNSVNSKNTVLSASLKTTNYTIAHHRRPTTSSPNIAVNITDSPMQTKWSVFFSAQVNTFTRWLHIKCLSKKIYRVRNLQLTWRRSSRKRLSWRDIVLLRSMKETSGKLHFSSYNLLIMVIMYTIISNTYHGLKVVSVGDYKIAGCILD